MNELLQTFIPPLNRLGLNYMVTGSVSAMLYGESRLTSDVDIVLTIQREQAKILMDAFQVWAFDHSIVAGVESIPVRFAPVEYVIIMMLEYFREGGSEKHTFATSAASLLPGNPSAPPKWPGLFRLVDLKNCGTNTCFPNWGVVVTNSFTQK